MKNAFILLVTLTSCHLLAQEKGTFTDSRDGHKYTWIKIGTKTWMAENLNFNAPDSLMPAKSYGDKFAINSCLDSKSQNCLLYGRYYDAKTAEKVCPSGWHLPDNNEWIKMFENFGEMKEKTQSDYSIRYGQQQGKMIKEGGASGFNAKLAGYSNFNISEMSRKFYSVGTKGYFWSSSNDGDAQTAWVLDKSMDDVERTDFDYDAKFHGLSVRCVKD